MGGGGVYSASSVSLRPIGDLRTGLFISSKGRGVGGGGKKNPLLLSLSSTGGGGDGGGRDGGMSFPLGFRVAKSDVPGEARGNFFSFKRNVTDV